MKKKIVFIGNRTQVLDVCLAEPDWEVGLVFAHRGSLLERELAARHLAHIPFAFADKEDVLRRLEAFAPIRVQHTGDAVVLRRRGRS